MNVQKKETEGECVFRNLIKDGYTLIYTSRAENLSIETKIILTKMNNRDWTKWATYAFRYLENQAITNILVSLFAQWLKRKYHSYSVKTFIVENSSINVKRYISFLNAFVWKNLKLKSGLNRCKFYRVKRDLDLMVSFI